jgi:ElaB/YqjD/DUF883 family membrane-anchored ribosome-binding protein
MRNEPGLAGLENDISVDPDVDRDVTDETEAIRGDIEGTRTNMSSTIDAIQEKLSPQRLTEQAKDAVRDATVGKVQDMASNIADTAKDTGSGLMDSIRENPLPAALVGIGVGWLFLSARRRAAERDRWRAGYGSGSRRSVNSYPDDRYGQYGSSQYRGQYGSSQPSQQENGKMSQMADTAKDKMSGVGERAQEMTDTLKERAGDMGEQAQWQARRARGWLEHTWDEYPLVVAGAALAAGALVGLSIPETQAERELMGEASGNVLQKAADTAQDVTQNASEKAQQVMQETTPDASKR